MKIILYMAMTVNGMVAGEDDGTSWVRFDGSLEEIVESGQHAPDEMRENM